MDHSDCFKAQQMVRPISILGAETPMNTFVLFEQDPPKSHGTFRSRISFTPVRAEDEEAAVGEVVGQEQSITLKSFDIGATNY